MGFFRRAEGGKSLDEGPKGGVLKEQIVKKLEAADYLRGPKTESWAYTRDVRDWLVSLRSKIENGLFKGY